jgi:ubiquinone biosynthesis protein UbiJ
MRINAQGEMQPVNNSIGADTTLTLSPFILARILTGESTALQLIKIIVNHSFAEELINIGKQINFSMIFEQDLSKIIGDIPAHRITNTSEHLIRWHTENFDHLSQALVEYWTEENSFLTKSSAINQFIEEVKNLQLNTEQLEQRLNRLSQKNP